jgi:hypothetical protein
MENETIFLSKDKNGEAAVFSTDGKTTQCLSQALINEEEIEPRIRELLPYDLAYKIYSNMLMYGVPYDPFEEYSDGE